MGEHAAPIQFTPSLKTSLHNHTIHSPSRCTAGTTIDRVVEAAFRHRVGILACTDYTGSAAFDELKARRAELRGSGYSVEDFGSRAADDYVLTVTQKGSGRVLYVLRGIEYHDNNVRREGHVVGIGFHGPITVEWSYQQGAAYNVVDAAKAIREQGGIVIAPHPFAEEALLGMVHLGGMGRAKLERLLERGLVDAIETYNSECICFLPGLLDASGANRKAQEFADSYSQERGFGGIAVNDARHPADIAISYFRMPAALINSSSGEAFVDGLRKAIALTSDPGLRQRMNCQRRKPWGTFVRHTIVPEYVPPQWASPVSSFLGEGAPEHTRRPTWRRTYSR